MVTQWHEYVGFFGQPACTVQPGGRLRLPAGVVRQLKGRRITKLWLGIIPWGKGLVLCPDGSWDKWVEDLKNEVAYLKTPQGKRVLFSPSTRVHWDKKGRVYIPVALMKHLGVGAGKAVVILGVKDYFEIWPKASFDEMLSRCRTDSAVPPNLSGESSSAAGKGGVRGRKADGGSGTGR